MTQLCLEANYLPLEQRLGDIPWTLERKAVSCLQSWGDLFLGCFRIPCSSFQSAQLRRACLALQWDMASHETPAFPE